MTNTGGSIRIDKSEKDKIKDFYQTPLECTKALVEFLIPLLDKNCDILDPCSGEMAITNQLTKYYNNVTSIDKFIGKNKIDFMKYNMEHDTIIMNPPYSAKYKFIDHAREIASNVFCILPLQTINYNMFHRDYMNIPEFVGKLVMTPKIIMGNDLVLKAGGVSSYAWFYWSKNNDSTNSLEWYTNLRDYI